MKNLIIQIALVIALGSISFNAAAQQRIDSTTAKIKLEKLQIKVQNSKTATYVGLGTIVSGGTLSVISDSNRIIRYVGAVFVGAGVITALVSGINWSVGKRKVKEYQIRLEDARTGFYYYPKSIGVTLAFKF